MWLTCIVRFTIVFGESNSSWVRAQANRFWMESYGNLRARHDSMDGVNTWDRENENYDVEYTAEQCLRVARFWQRNVESNIYCGYAEP